MTFPLNRHLDINLISRLCVERFGAHVPCSSSTFSIQNIPTLAVSQRPARVLRYINRCLSVLYPSLRICITLQEIRSRQCNVFFRCFKIHVPNLECFSQSFSAKFRYILPRSMAENSCILLLLHNCQRHYSMSCLPSCLQSSVRFLQIRKLATHPLCRYFET
jgi:hypothetical protein